jgi:hypothetical protein
MYQPVEVKTNTISLKSLNPGAGEAGNGGNPGGYGL